MLIRSHLRVWAVAILLVGAISLVARADDKPAAKKAAEKKAAAAKDESDSEAMEKMEKDDKDEEEMGDGKGRMPTYFARLGLTPDEKTKIQASLAKFDDSIKKAEAEVKKLHADRDTAAEKLLTSDQHKMLTKIRDEAKAARAKKAADTPSKKKSKKGNGEIRKVRRKV